MSEQDVYVITGGAGGMGLACAETLADRGRLLLAVTMDRRLGNRAGHPVGRPSSFG